MKMGIERRLKERIPEIMEVEQIMDTETARTHGPPTAPAEQRNTFPT